MIPFVDTIYRSTKRFLTVAQQTPDGQRRVVLIDFPSRHMKTVGLVTRTLKDAETGEELRRTKHVFAASHKQNNVLTKHRVV